MTTFVGPGWIDASIVPMLADDTVDYTGGPVYPIWEAPAPSWLRRDRGDLWGAIAILDYGRSSFVFEDHGRIPIGANMAVRRTMLDAVGGFDPELGRRGTSLLGQEQLNSSVARVRRGRAERMFQTCPFSITCPRSD
jgi:hypothetical protein